MCQLCAVKTSALGTRRGFLLAAGATVAVASAPARGQVDVGEASRLRKLVPAAELEQAAAQQYHELLREAQAKGVLAPPNHPQLRRLRAIAARLIPHAQQWNPRAGDWRWEVNLIQNRQINAFVMPGGKIAFYTGILDRLQLTDEEIAMVMGHEMAHALREHARERIAKATGTGALLSLGAALFGLGQLGDFAADIGTQLLTLKFSRDDEVEADLVGLEIGARAGFDPQAAVSLWEKMARAAAGSGGPAFLSTHPTGVDRIRRLQANVPRVRALYERALAHRR